MRIPRLLLLVLILAGAASLYFLGNSRISLWDRDEPRYAQCSREMLQSGDWVVPRFLGELRAHKPPLIYWCQATAMEVMGQTGYAARFPSAMATILSAALLAAFVWRFAGPRRAVWTTLVFCTCGLVMIGAKLCLTDGVLLLWVCIGQGCLYLIWRQRAASLRVTLIFWASVALAGLTKGPVVLAVHGGALLILAYLDEGNWKQRIGWWRALRPLLGLVIVVAIDLPWLILVEQRAPDFLALLFHRASRYASSGAEGHAHYPGYYLYIIWAVMFPWSLLLPLSIGFGIRHRKQKLLRFALAAAIGPWIVMELIPNKLPLYILPSFPALAVLVGHAIVRGSRARMGRADDDLKQRGFLVGVAIWALAVVGGAVVPYVLPKELRVAESMGIAWSILCIVYLLIVAWCFVGRHIRVACGAMGIGMAVLMAMFFGCLLPSLATLSASRSIGQELNAEGAGGSTPVAMIDYREPSVAFYQGGGARESDPTALLSPNPPQWAVVTLDTLSTLPPAVRARYQIVGKPQVIGSYNDGWRTESVAIIHLTK